MWLPSLYVSVVGLDLEMQCSGFGFSCINMNIAVPLGSISMIAFVVKQCIVVRSQNKRVSFFLQNFEFFFFQKLASKEKKVPELEMIQCI